MTAPLVRARVVEYLAAHIVPGVRRWGGQVQVDATVPDMAHELGISPHDVVETLWNLQKNQIVTFRERKGPGGSHISKIRLAESALNGVTIHDLTTKGEAIHQAIDVLEVTEDIIAEATLIVSVPGITCRYRKVAPEWCIEHDAKWPHGDNVCTAEWQRTNPEVVDEAGAVAQYDDASTTSPEVIVDDLPVLLIPPILPDYPVITALLAERETQAAVNRAADILLEAGQESLALTVAEAIQPFSSLQEEVFRLAEALGWVDRDG